MPYLPHSIALEGSVLSAVTHHEDQTVTLTLGPAYIHQAGQEWRQEAEITLSEASTQTRALPLPVRIFDAQLKTAVGLYHNLLNLPLQLNKPVILDIELFDGAMLRLEGQAVVVRLLGTPTLIETLEENVF